MKKKRTCKFPGCSKKRNARGYCKSHINQFYRCGEMWEIGTRKSRKGLGCGPSPEKIEKIREAVHKANWKGGRLIDADGYVRLHIYDKKDPYKGKQVYEHRLVMEKHLGRMLEPGEEIHHLDFNKQNNAITNLVIVSHYEHMRLHRGRKNKGYIQHNIRRGKGNGK